MASEGRTILSKGYGWADSGRRIGNRPDTLFDVGSVAKTFTAAAILDLEARGKLNVADPLAKHVTGLPSDKQAITLHHLLTHMSGYSGDASDIGVTAADSTDQLLAKAASAKLLDRPGAAYHYSNVGYGLLAHVIEKVSGQSWQAYVRERLVDRAGLRGTFLWGESIPPKKSLAQGYTGPAEAELQPQPPLTQDAQSSLLWGKYLLGSGGVFSNVGDLNLWWCVLNGPRLLPQPQRAKMFTVQAANQGYGWNIAAQDGRVTRIHRGGLRGSYQSLVAYYPQRRDLVVYGINKNVSNMWARLAWRNLERILAGEAYTLPPRLAVVAPEVAAGLAGTYGLPAGGKLRLLVKGEALHFGAEGQDALDPLTYGDEPVPEARDRLHQASRDLVLTLRRGDESGTLRTARMSAGDSAKLIAQWRLWTDRTGPILGTELLGSTPGAGGHVRVFLRLRGSGGDLVVRLLWDAARLSLLAWGDDIALPAFARLWPQGEDRWVSHDFDTGRTMYFRFGKTGTLRILSDTGETLLEARKPG